MNKDQLMFIKHIRDFINDLEEYTFNVSKTNFLSNKMLQDAVIRKIETLGEAVKNISASFRLKYPEVPWSDIAATRDKLIHHYFGSGSYSDSSGYQAQVNAHSCDADNICEVNALNLDQDATVQGAVTAWQLTS